MHYDELLEKVKDNPTTLAVVKLHKPYPSDYDQSLWCIHCQDIYPCPTIKAIEKELG